jgi:hypothetical protein
MAKTTCKDSPCRKRLAVSLSYAASTLLSLEALHGGTCEMFNLTVDQYFMLKAVFATVMVFLGTFILTQIIKPTE